MYYTMTHNLGQRQQGSSYLRHRSTSSKRSLKASSHMYIRLVVGRRSSLAQSSLNIASIRSTLLKGLSVTLLRHSSLVVDTRKDSHIPFSSRDPRSLRLHVHYQSARDHRLRVHNQHERDAAEYSSFESYASKHKSPKSGIASKANTTPCTAMAYVIDTPNRR